jgi:hypothetical protein
VRATHFIHQDLDLASQELSILVTIAEFACLWVPDSEYGIENVGESGWVVFGELEDLLLALLKTTPEYRLNEVDSIAKKLICTFSQTYFYYIFITAQTYDQRLSPTSGKEVTIEHKKHPFQGKLLAKLSEL